MIDKGMTMRFISKLIELTTTGEIKWTTIPQYFDENDNEPLRKYVISNNQYTYMPIEAKRVFLINEYRSFCVSIHGGVIIVFRKTRETEEELEIMIQTDTAQELHRLIVDNEVQIKLKELMRQISNSIDNIAGFINTIIKM